MYKGPSHELVALDAVAAPFLFSSPHSGRNYPASFLKVSRLDPVTLRRSEDSYVDELFAGVPGLGLPLLRALFPRAFVDVNREPYELDPRMYAGRLPEFANTRSVRVAGGLGTIARIVTDTHEIYDGPLEVADALTRISRLYKPYHDTLSEQLVGLNRAFGVAVLIDCHSMPSTAAAEEYAARPDIVLGDRYGTSCSARLIDVAQACLERMGYGVRRNRPYAGGYITERYGRPRERFHALQIEINRALYMDEQTLEKKPDFKAVQADMTRFARTISEMPLTALSPPAIAAE